MRSHLLLILVVVLYNSCTGYSLSIRPHEDADLQYFDRNIESTDLNEDCLYLIFDQLELVDLLNIARINPAFAHLASGVFSQKYSDYTVKIPKIKPDTHQKPFEIEQSTKTIQIFDLEFFSNVMKYFGNRIHNLNIWNPSQNIPTYSSEWTQLNRIANEYGSESLTKLILHMLDKKLWPHFNLPFENVEELYIGIEDDTDGMKLNQLFPKLKKLRVWMKHGANFDFLNCELPHLDHLVIDISDSISVWNRSEQLTSLLIKNPQIRSVIGDYILPELTKAISEQLPNIENLTLWFDDNRYEPIHFESVKHCILRTLQGSTIRKLSFSHLESLKITFGNSDYNKYNEFFRRHRSLTQLHARLSWDLTPDLNALTAELPNLKVLILESPNAIGIQSVATLIENNSELMKIEFPIHEVSENDRKRFCRTFEENWHIKSIINIDQKDAFLMEKKMRL